MDIWKFNVKLLAGEVPIWAKKLPTQDNTTFNPFLVKDNFFIPANIIIIM